MRGTHRPVYWEEVVTVSLDRPMIFDLCKLSHDGLIVKGIFGPPFTKLELRETEEPSSLLFGVMHNNADLWAPMLVVVGVRQGLYLHVATCIGKTVKGAVAIVGVQRIPQDTLPAKEMVMS